MSALAKCKCEVRRRCPRKWLGSEHTDHALCAPPSGGAKTTDGWSLVSSSHLGHGGAADWGLSFLSLNLINNNLFINTNTNDIPRKCVLFDPKYIAKLIISG